MLQSALLLYIIFLRLCFLYFRNIQWSHNRNFLRELCQFKTYVCVYKIFNSKCSYILQNSHPHGIQALCTSQVMGWSKNQILRFGFHFYIAISKLFCIRSQNVNFILLLSTCSFLPPIIYYIMYFRNDVQPSCENTHR